LDFRRGSRCTVRKTQPNPSAELRSRDITLGQNVRFCEGFRMPAHDGGAAHTGAGVRKPPMEETAMGERMMVPRS